MRYSHDIVIVVAHFIKIVAHYNQKTFIVVCWCKFQLDFYIRYVIRPPTKYKHDTNNANELIFDFWSRSMKYAGDYFKAAFQTDRTIAMNTAKSFKNILSIFRTRPFIWTHPWTHPRQWLQFSTMNVRKPICKQSSRQAVVDDSFKLFAKTEHVNTISDTITAHLYTLTDIM